MAINRVEIKDFLVFKGEFALDFCPGVNVLIGGNATGKTTLLRCLYELKDQYLLMNDETGNLVMNGNTGKLLAENLIGKRERKWGRAFIDDDGDAISFVYIPEKDMLSHSKGFISLYQERELPFGGIFADILLKAQLPVTREIKPNAKKVIGKIKEIIGGEVTYENDAFFTVKDNGERISFSLEASGFLKFGLLWKLLRNGLLERGTILFWDEPENSLNPELIPILVDILLELSRNGVQVFLATHSEILASYFAVNRKRNDSVMFHSLYRESEFIRVESGDRFDLLDNNKLSSEPVKLYKKQLERGLSGNG